MRITELSDLTTALKQAKRAWFLSTESNDALPIARAAAELTAQDSLTAFIGPEGGWTEHEWTSAQAHGVRLVTLGRRTLRADAVPVAAMAVLQFLWGDL